MEFQPLLYFVSKMKTRGMQFVACLSVITGFVSMVSGHSCQCEYEAQRCMQSAVTPYGDDVYKVTARPTPAWPAGVFCMAIPWNLLDYETIGSSIAPGENVKLVFSADIRGTRGTSHIGVAINYHNYDNYDAFYIRLHSQELVQGSVVNGQWVSAIELSLPDEIQVSHDQFFTVWVEVFVRTRVVKIYAVERDTLLHEYTSHSATTGVFGLVTANGYLDQIAFTNVEAKMETISEPTTPAPGELGPPELYRCSTEEAVQNPDGSWTVTAYIGSWSTDNFCYGIPRDVINAGPVILSTSTEAVVYHFQLKGTTGLSHVGMAFNIHDNNNYDAFYFRIHGQDFVVGKVENGVWSNMYDAGLPNGIAIPNNAFFDVWVEIIPVTKQTSVFANTRDSLVRTFIANFDFANVFGPATANGYGDSATFKDVTITVSGDGGQQSGYELHRCSSDALENVDGASRVTARSDISWPGGLFCMAIPWDIVNDIPTSPGSLITSSGYVYHAMLKGTDNLSHIGFAFNIQDADNYEFFYLRIHGQQLVIGNVANAVMTINYDAALPQGVTVPNSAFFPVWFEISSDGLYASIYVHDRFTLVHSFSPVGPFKAVFAMITGNGYIDSVTFKDVGVSKYGCMESW